MSCSRKSENGKKSTSSSAATALEPVRMAGKWQSAQPIPRNMPSPSFASRVRDAGAGRQERDEIGEHHRRFVGVVGIGLCRIRGEQGDSPPAGQFSFGKNGVVTPISFW